MADSTLRWERYGLFGSLAVGKGNDDFSDDSAWFEIGNDNTDKGFLLPRVSSVDVVVNPKKGLMVHDNSVGLITSFDGTEWVYYATGSSIEVPQPQNGCGYYYVSRNYLGKGNAVITSTTDKPTSVNTDYNEQLDEAKPNNPFKPYPDPYAARAAALTDIAASKIARAFIIVERGNRWTVGSTLPSQNGDATGNAAAQTVADIQFANGHSPTIANLLHPNITYDFGEDSGFDYINKAFTIYFGYILNKTSTTKAAYVVRGNGIFRQIYGTANGFNAVFLHVEDSSGTLRHNYKRLVLNQGTAFQIADIGYHFLDVEDIWSYENNLFDLLSTMQSTTYSYQVHVINIKNIQTSNKGDFGMAPTINGAATTLRLQGLAFPSRVTINIQNCYQLAYQGQSFMTYGAQVGANDIHAVITVDNMIHKAEAQNHERSLMNLYFSGHTNCKFTIRFKNAYFESPLVKTYGSFQNVSANCYGKLILDSCEYNMKNQITNTAFIYNVVQYSAAHTNLLLEINGMVNITNGTMYWENINNTTNGMLCLFKNCLVTAPTSNLANLFVKGSNTDKCLALDSVVIKAANGLAFGNPVVGANANVWIQNVSTTDAAPISNITFQGDMLKTIPTGYFK